MTFPESRSWRDRIKEENISTIYLISDHGKLNRNNGIFEFTDCNGNLRKIFPHNTEAFIISGVVTITGAAMNLLMTHRINTIFTGQNGEYRGKLEFDAGKNVTLKMKQYAVSADAKTSLALAKSIVKAKIRNELSFVQRIKRKNDSETELLKVVDALKSILNDVENCADKNELRGYEGIAARNYYAAFRSNLIPEWAYFPRRSMHPPLSNVNAALSFLYTLLMNRVAAAVEAAGLDPMFGFLHAVDYGKQTLVFDLMEEFRTPVADILCCSLFNWGVFSAADFRITGENVPAPSTESPAAPPSTPETGTSETAADTERPTLLTRDGILKTIAAFEKKMETTLFYKPLNTEIPINTIIIEQVKHFKQVLLDGEAEYRGYVHK